MGESAVQRFQEKPAKRSKNLVTEPARQKGTGHRPFAAGDVFFLPAGTDLAAAGAGFRAAAAAAAGGVRFAAGQVLAAAAAGLAGCLAAAPFGAAGAEAAPLPATFGGAEALGGTCMHALMLQTACSCALLRCSTAVPSACSTFFAFFGAGSSSSESAIAAELSSLLLDASPNEADPLSDSSPFAPAPSSLLLLALSPL